MVEGNMSRSKLLRRGSIFYLKGSFFLCSVFFSIFIVFFREATSARHAKVQFLLVLTQSVDRCIVIPVASSKK